jgi:hypothetical protein
MKTCTSKSFSLHLQKCFIMPICHVWTSMCCFSMGRRTWRKFKGAVDWSGEHATYVALWNQRQTRRMYYGSDIVHRSGPYKEYLKWLHLQPWLFLKPAYTEEHIAQLPDSHEDNEIIDEYDAITGQGTQQPERAPFQTWYVFFIFAFSMFIENEVLNIHYCCTGYTTWMAGK